MRAGRARGRIHDGVLLKVELLGLLLLVLGSVGTRFPEGNRRWAGIAPEAGGAARAAGAGAGAGFAGGSGGALWYGVARGDLRDVGEGRGEACYGAAGLVRVDSAGDVFPDGRSGTAGDGVCAWLRV